MSSSHSFLLLMNHNESLQIPQRMWFDSQSSQNLPSILLDARQSTSRIGGDIRRGPATWMVVHLMHSSPVEPAIEFSDTWSSYRIREASDLQQGASGASGGATGGSPQQQLSPAHPAGNAEMKTAFAYPTSAIGCSYVRLFLRCFPIGGECAWPGVDSKGVFHFSENSNEQFLGITIVRNS